MVDYVEQPARVDSDRERMEQMVVAMWARVGSGVPHRASGMHICFDESGTFRRSECRNVAHTLCRRDDGAGHIGGITAERLRWSAGFMECGGGRLETS